jgi:hypothetical protein
MIGGAAGREGRRPKASKGGKRGKGIRGRCGARHGDLSAADGMLLSWVKVANPSSQDRTPHFAILSALVPAVVPYRASGLVR